MALMDSRDLLAVLSLAALSLAEGITHFGQIYPDSVGYIATARYFQGTGEPSRFRLLRPVIPFLASMVGRFVDLRTAFAIVNLLLWCSAAILMFLFTRELTKNARVSFLAAGFFTVMIPLLFYGDAVLTDMAGYFFVLVGIYAITSWDIFKSNYVKVLTAAAIMAVALLSRETTASVLVVAIVWTMISKGSFRKLTLFIAVPLAAVFLWSLLVGVSYWDWALANAAVAAKEQALSPLQRVWIWLYTIRLAFRPEILLVAAIGFLKSVKSDVLSKYLAILAGVSIFLLVAPGIVDYRYTFILFPAVAPLAAVGTNELCALVSRYIPGEDRGRTTTLLGFLVLIAYAVVTNWITFRFLSFPWRPYVQL